MVQLRITVYLLVSAILPWLDGSLADVCKEDEYYDGVFDECRPCKPICEPCDENTNGRNFCLSLPKCADYYKKVCGRDGTHSPPTRSSVFLPRSSATKGVIPAADPEVQAPREVAPKPPNIMTNPLLWLSISCIFLAILAILIVLCVMFYYVRTSRDRLRAPLITGSTHGYSRSTSQVSSNSCSNCQDKKCVVTIIPEENRMLPDIQRVHNEN